LYRWPFAKESPLSRLNGPTPIRLAVETSVELEDGMSMNTDIVSTNSAPSTLFSSDLFDVPAAIVAEVSAAGMNAARDPPGIDVTAAICTAGA